MTGVANLLVAVPLCRGFATHVLLIVGCCITTITCLLQVIRHFEFTPAYGSLRSHKFEALITTYELVLKDAEVSPSPSRCASQWHAGLNSFNGVAFTRFTRSPVLVEQHG